MILPWDAIAHLKNLWLPLVADLPQGGSRPWLIFGLTWNEINKAVTPQAPQEEMGFMGTLRHILQSILWEDPQLVPVYLSKVDLADPHMRI